MELNGSYDLNFLSVEEITAQKYRKGIKELKESKDHKRNLEILTSMFNSLGESHPPRGEGVKWALEIILAYRNLTRIMKEISNQEDISFSVSSKYSELIGSCGGLEKSIERLNKIEEIMQNHNYKIEELDMVFERLEEFENNIKQKDEKLEELELL